MSPGKEDHPHPLYEYEGNDIYYSDFVRSLEEVGIQKADTVLVTSDISVFGKLRLLDRELLCNALIDAIKEAVGKQGTIVMPTYSYSFCNNDVFDINNTPSTVGVLTEHFRQQLDTARTAQPIFSMGVWGKHQEELLNIGSDCFDSDSVFGKLHGLLGKFLFFGAPFHSCTFLHYVEQLHGVPYRFMKSYTGTIRDGEDVHEATCSYFVRHLDGSVAYDLTRFEPYLRQNGMLSEARVGSGRMLAVDLDNIFEQANNMLDMDIYYFLKEPLK